MSKQHVIIGSGPLGQAVADALLEKGLSVVMTNRSGRSNRTDVETMRVLTEDTSSLVRAIQGASVVYQCAQPAYDRWTEEFLPMQRAILDVAAQQGARVVLGDNLYPYGAPGNSVITEDSVENTTTRKGLVRKAMADEALEAHRAGRVEVAISRPSDYFGPGYSRSEDMWFRRAVQGKRMQFLGRDDMPHTFSFMPDIGRAMAEMGVSEQAWGKVWIPPVQQAVTQAELAARIWKAAGRDSRPKYMKVGRATISLMGVFTPMVREVLEVMYGYEEPYVVSSQRFEETFGMTATPLNTAISESVRLLRK